MTNDEGGRGLNLVIRGSTLIRHSPVGFVISAPEAFGAAKGFTYSERTYILQASCRFVLQKEAEETLFVRRRGMARP